MQATRIIFGMMLAASAVSARAEPPARLRTAARVRELGAASSGHRRDADRRQPGA